MFLMLIPRFPSYTLLRVLISIAINHISYFATHQTFPPNCFLVQQSSLSWSCFYPQFSYFLEVWFWNEREEINFSDDMSNQGWQEWATDGMETLVLAGCDDFYSNWFLCWKNSTRMDDNNSTRRLLASSSDWKWSHKISNRNFLLT